MQFILQKEDLMKELKVLKKIKHNNSIYGEAIKIHSNNGSLLITGSNADLTVETRVDAKIKDCKNSLYLNKNLLYSIISSLPRNSVVSFKDNNHKVLIENHKTRYSLAELSSKIDHLNQTLNSEFEKKVSIKFGVLKDAINKAVKFTRADSYNEVLTGINFNLNNSFQINSTNSNLLFTTILSSTKEKNFEITLNSSDLKVLLSIDASRFADVNICFPNAVDVVKFSVGKYTFYFSKISGAFPKFSDILNSAIKENKNEIVVEKDSILSEVKKAKQVNDAVVIFSIKKDSINILSEDRELGKYQGSVKCKTKVNEYKKIALNPKYVETILSCIDDDLVHIFYDTELRPLLFNKKDEKYLLMPMKT